MRRRRLPWLWDIPRSPRWILALAAVNLGGTVYGFWWYREQLAATAPPYWPVVPDSPTATLLFGLFLLSIYPGAGRREGRRSSPLLWAAACCSSFKYGLWTPLVMAHFWVTTGLVTFESVHLTLSHLGMALEAVIFARYYRAGWRHVFAVTAWLLFNDYMDYVRGFHPTLPVPGAEGWAGGAALALTLLAAASPLFVPAAARCSR